MSSPRYAPAREDGTKPYVVTVACGRDGCSHDTDRLVWALGVIPADHAALARERDDAYVVASRRATPEDVTNLKEYR